MSEDLRSPWRFPPPPPAPELADGEIHVWCARLDHPPGRVQRFAHLLSPDELARAGRYRFERDRRRYIVSHALLRAILGRYLAVEPGGLTFGFGPRGKPFLEGAGSRLGFNLSHSDELAVFGFARGRELGVDVERVRPLEDAPQIAERFFAPGERRALARLPETERLEAFFVGWTRKEAFTKATGEGLNRPLDGFEVSLAPGEPARLIHVDGDRGAAARWTVWDLRPAPEFVAALVGEGKGARINRWQWPG